MKYLALFCLLLLAACAHENTSNSNPAGDTTAKTPAYHLTDKTIKFVWRDDRYDPELKDTFNTIIVNEDFCKHITDPERAALGYVGTFTGSECNWDGEAKDDFSNLKCKVIAALSLGYQCSETHLGFLRKWFRNDTAVLHRLQECPQVPFTASSQETFNEINLTVKKDSIKVWFSASGINMPMGQTWDYTEEDIFILHGDYLSLAKINQSKIARDSFDTGAE